MHGGYSIQNTITQTGRSKVKDAIYDDITNVVQLLRHKQTKRPRGHVAHLINICHNSNRLAGAFGIKDSLSSLIQTMESKSAKALHCVNLFISDDYM